MGLTFKENCPDLRNTKVIDVIRELESYGVGVDVHDPWVDPEEALEHLGVSMVETPKEGVYDAVFVPVLHECFREIDCSVFLTSGDVVFSLKNLS
jgi:UDP-N-acetyl-D-galactosamine dehydrogenase